MKEAIRILKSARNILEDQKYGELLTNAYSLVNMAINRLEKEQISQADNGIPLRDYMACHVAAGIMANEPIDWGRTSPQHIAEASYQLADQLLIERNRKEE